MFSFHRAITVSPFTFCSWAEEWTYILEGRMLNALIEGPVEDTPTVSTTIGDEELLQLLRKELG